MNRRLVRLLLALYPRAYRDRYGAEVVRLTEELIAAGEVTPAEGALNLAAAAAAERGRALADSWRTAAAMALAALVAVAGSFYVAGHARHPAPASAASAAPAQASLARVLCLISQAVPDGTTAVAGLVPAGPAFTVNLPAGIKLTPHSRLLLPVTFAEPGKGKGKGKGKGASRACVAIPAVCRTGMGRTVTVSPGLTVNQVTIEPGRCALANPDKAAASGP
jgi:hypothetical protein